MGSSRIEVATSGCRTWDSICERMIQTVAVALQAGYRSVKSLRSTVTDHDQHRYWCRVAAWLVDSVTAIPND